MLIGAAAERVSAARSTLPGVRKECNREREGGREEDKNCGAAQQQQRERVCALHSGCTQ